MKQSNAEEIDIKKWITHIKTKQNQKNGDYFADDAGLWALLIASLVFNSRKDRPNLTAEQTDKMNKMFEEGKYDELADYLDKLNEGE